MAYFWQKQKKEDGTEELAIPKELEDQIKAGAEGAAKITKVEEMLAGLVSIQQTEANERKAAREAAERAAAAKARTESEGSLEEQIEALMLEGKTKDAITLATKGQTDGVKLALANDVRREVFEDEEKFPYYSGDIKRKVDALIASQGLDFRLNAQNVENCYHTILGQHTKELVEGKIKTRFASSDGGSRGTSSGAAGDSGAGKDKKTRTFDADMEKDLRKAAQQTGIKYEDYVEMLDKEGVI